MITKYSRLRVRRKFRARKKAIAQTAETANKGLERHVFRRTHNWQFAKRFFITWLALIVIIAGGLLLQIRSLSATYLVVTPTGGGVYNEGIVGNIKNINPIFASSSADISVSTLVFSSLLTYNNNNQLIGDIAKEWKSDATSKVFTVTLRDDVYWQDGEKLTADDVLFTYQTMQNPDTKSPYYSTWRGIKIEKVDDKTIVFTLPNAYSPFLHLLTNGVVPEHILASVPKDQLRGSKFNTQEAVGSGPFKLSSVTVEKSSDIQTSETIQMVKYDSYHRGEVQLDGFTLKTYPDDRALKDALKNKDVIGALIDNSDNDTDFSTIRFNQTSAAMLFMNTTRPLLTDLKMRNTLISATDVARISSLLDYPTTPVRSPILKDQIGYDASQLQQPYKPDAVNNSLNELGWVWNEGEPYRKKDGKELTLQFVSENTTEYSRFAEEVQKQWAQFGIKTNVVLENPDEIGTTSLADKEYDILLYAINIGPDPDVYVYWHSSQAKPDAKPGFNFSQYSSTKADQSLEDGRSRADPTLRAIKYKPLLEAWKADIPAIGLHQPRVAYTTNSPVYNLDEMTINTVADRYRNVYNWQITTTKTTQK
jgi:peptide/nickel transport system substrate-binding protein